MLVRKGVLKHSAHEVDEFISTIFLHPKKDGSYHMILNLKALNQFVGYHTIFKWTLYGQLCK